MFQSWAQVPKFGSKLSSESQFPPCCQGCLDVEFRVAYFKDRVKEVTLKSRSESRSKLPWSFEFGLGWDPLFQPRSIPHFLKGKETKTMD